VAALPETYFWDLTPGEVDDILFEAVEEIRAKEYSAARNAALICASLYNCHRDPKAHPDPFTADDFLPSRTPPPPPPSDEEVAHKGRQAMKILTALNQ